MPGFDTDEIIQELFKSLLRRYQLGLEQSMKGNDIVSDGVEKCFASFIR